MIGYVRQIIRKDTYGLVKLVCKEWNRGYTFTTELESEKVPLDIQIGDLISIFSSVTTVVNCDNNHVYPEGTIGT